MTIQLLGTGAADGIPALFSQSEVSRYARDHGGKDIRTRSAALIDGTLKIDLGPDTLAQVQRLGLDPTQWSAIVFTHSHDDHFCVTELQYALYPFNCNEFAPYTVYGNAEVCDEIVRVYPQWPFEVCRTRSFEPFCHGPYRITPIRANHNPPEDAQNLIISRDGKSLLYATDTGLWEEATWEFLKGHKLDLLIIECTEGQLPTDYFGHLAISDCVEVVGRLRREGILNENARVITTHHSHKGMATHAELEQLLAPHGMEPGYDGMEISI